MEKITKESINLTTVDKMCRTCLWQTDETKSLFSVLDDNRLLGDVLLAVANINVRKDDNLPKQICAECEMFIHKADQFKRRCFESEEILNEVLNEAKINTFDDKPVVKYEVPTEQKVVDNQFRQPGLIDDKEERKFTLVEAECKNIIKLELNDDSEITEFAEEFDNVFDVEPIDYKSEGMNVDDIFAKFFDKNYKPKKRIGKHTQKDVTRKKLLKEKEEPKYQCHLCMRKFTKKNSLIIHIEKHEENAKIKFTCDLCKREFQRQVSLDKHIISVHTRRKGYRCDICLKMLPTEELLETHKNMHKTEKKPLHNCKFCNKAFYMMSTLKDHLRTHTGEKPYLCSICGKGFSQKNNLAQHVRRHQGEKPFKCNECERSFVSKGELQAHKRKHTGAHPFVCDDCGNGFTTSSSLVKHRRTHTGERPYACDMCPMKFAASGTLKTHRRTHTGEKPYQCSYCEKAFAQRNDLVTHIRCHTGERPFVCTTCGLSFRKASALKSHAGLHCKEPQRDVTLNVLQGVNMLLNP